MGAGSLLFWDKWDQESALIFNGNLTHAEGFAHAQSVTKITVTAPGQGPNQGAQFKGPKVMKPDPGLENGALRQGEKLYFDLVTYLIPFGQLVLNPIAAVPGSGGIAFPTADLRAIVHIGRVLMGLQMTVIAMVLHDIGGIITGFGAV